MQKSARAGDETSQIASNVSSSEAGGLGHLRHFGKHQEPALRAPSFDDQNGEVDAGGGERHNQNRYGDQVHSQPTLRSIARGSSRAAQEQARQG